MSKRDLTGTYWYVEADPFLFLKPLMYKVNGLGHGGYWSVTDKNGNFGLWTYNGVIGYDDEHSAEEISESRLILESVQ